MARRKISGKRVLLTGASSGIGWELAKQLAAQGARLVITARRIDRLEELIEEIGTDAEIHSVPGDITDPDLRNQLIDVVRDKLGGLDILINNAGVGAIGNFATADKTRLRNVMEVNFFAPVELTRSLLPMLGDGEQPMIVNISSVLGHRAVPKKSEYCASKFALHGFSDALRAELSGEGIDVLIVSPSTTQTEFFDNVLEDTAKLPWLKMGAAPAAYVARKTVSAIRRGRHEVILTVGGKALVWLDRLCPPIINRLVARFG